MFFLQQKPAYEVRISDWSSDVGSSDLITNMKASKVSADNKGGKTPRRQSDQGKSAVGRLGNALHGRRIGIGFRLFGAFGAVAFLTLVATGKIGRAHV